MEMAIEIAPNAQMLVTAQIPMVMASLTLSILLIVAMVLVIATMTAFLTT